MENKRVTIKAFLELAHSPDNCVIDGFHALKHAIRFEAQILGAICTNLTESRKMAQDLAPDVAQRIARMCVELPESDWNKSGLKIPATGMLAVAERKKYATKEALAGSKPVVFLEEPRNLGNIGAVIRVAAGADAGGVMASGTVDLWSEGVTRGAAGLQFSLPIIKLSALPQTSRPIVAFDPDGEDMSNTLIPENAILCFGTERSGLSKDILERADKRIRIPMRENVSSLNLATSVAIALYVLKLSRQS